MPATRSTSSRSLRPTSSKWVARVLYVQWKLVVFTAGCSARRMRSSSVRVRSARVFVHCLIERSLSFATRCVWIMHLEPPYRTRNLDVNELEVLVVCPLSFSVFPSRQQASDQQTRELSAINNTRGAGAGLSVPLTAGTLGRWRKQQLRKATGTGAQAARCCAIPQPSRGRGGRRFVSVVQCAKTSRVATASNARSNESCSPTVVSKVRSHCSHHARARTDQRPTDASLPD